MTEAERERRTRDDADALGLLFVSGSLPAVASSVTELRRAVTSFAREQGFDAEAIDRIGLAVSEAAGNVVLHAYPPAHPGVIGYVADMEEGDLQVVVTDEGSGILADHPSEGLGFGLGLIAQLASDFGIAPREPSGLEVWMRFVPE